MKFKVSDRSAVQITDAQAARAFLTELSCQVLRWDGVGKICLIEDPFGFHFNLWQEAIEN